MTTVVLILELIYSIPIKSIVASFHSEFKPEYILVEVPTSHMYWTGTERKLCRNHAYNGTVYSEQFFLDFLTPPLIKNPTPTF